MRNFIPHFIIYVNTLFVLGLNVIHVSKLGTWCLWACHSDCHAMPEPFMNNAINLLIGCCGVIPLVMLHMGIDPNHHSNCNCPLVYVIYGVFLFYSYAYTFISEYAFRSSSWIDLSMYLLSYIMFSGWLDGVGWDGLGVRGGGGWGHYPRKLSYRNSHVITNSPFFPLALAILVDMMFFSAKSNQI